MVFGAVRNEPAYSVCLTLPNEDLSFEFEVESLIPSFEFSRVAEACRGSSACSLNKEALESARLKIQLSETGLAIKTRSAHSQVQILPSAPIKLF
jgi:hypothetical protein